MTKKDSWCKYSVNLKDLAKITEGEIVLIEKQDNGYNYNIKNIDQTARFNAMAQDIIIIKKV